MSTSFLRRLLRDHGGNVTTLYALLAPVLVFGTGAAIDYGRAAQMRSKLNAAADAAALAALTPNMLQQTSAVAEAAAASLFQGLTNGMPGLSGTSVQVQIAAGANSLERDVTVNYSTSVSTLFAAVLGRSALPVSGTSTAKALIPPNIDFYVLLDNSPSMALPATTAGITQMQSLTAKQGGGGCAFACHQADTGTNQSDTIYNPCSDGTAPTVTANNYYKAYCDVTHHGAQLDNYALARKNGIALRLDELTSGVTTLLQTASQTAASSQFTTPPQYRFAIYSIEFAVVDRADPARAADERLHQPVVGSRVDLRRHGDVRQQQQLREFELHVEVGSRRRRHQLRQFARQAQPDELHPQSRLRQQSGGRYAAEGSLHRHRRRRGRVYGGGRLQQAINDLGAAPGGNSASTNWCAAIKNRGIKIAILYTDYLPVTSNSWYNTWIKPFQSSIAPALQACASPGLFYDASIGDDLGAALSSLFAAVMQSGHLTQ